MRVRRANGWSWIAKHRPGGPVLGILYVDEKTCLYNGKVLRILPQLLRDLLLDLFGIGLTVTEGNGNRVAGRQTCAGDLPGCGVARRCLWRREPLAGARLRVLVVPAGGTDLPIAGAGTAVGNPIRRQTRTILLVRGGVGER